MHRRPLLTALEAYRPIDSAERAARDQIASFVNAHVDCFERSLEIGHITGSAWVWDPLQRRVFLVHHAKLGKWLQPGGHADGESDVAAVALREAQEESGLERLRCVSDVPFDLDVHEIPKRGDEPAHLHYDVRYLIEGDASEDPQRSVESLEVGWVTAAEVGRYTFEPSILRMLAKAESSQASPSNRSAVRKRRKT